MIKILIALVIIDICLGIVCLSLLGLVGLRMATTFQKSIEIIDEKLE